MNPVTSILSPDKKHVLLYFVNKDKRQLAMSEIPVDSSARLLSYTDYDTPQGEVALEQCIQAVTLRGLPTVYGWIEPNLIEPGNDKVLAKLSPVTNYLDKTARQKSMTTTIPSFAAATDGVSKTYLYFLKRPSENADPLLYETVQTYDTTNTKVSGSHIQISAKSRLAVSYNPDSGSLNTRTVFFQHRTDGDNNIYWVEFSDSKDPTSISTVDGTEGAKDGTPIAVTRGDDGTLWLYWMSSENNLQRSTKVKNGSWSVTTEGIQNIPHRKLLASSQISLTQVISGNVRENHVFYIEAYGEEILDHIDRGL